MHTLREAIQAIERLGEQIRVRDELLLSLTKRIDALEKSGLMLAPRPPIRRLKRPKCLDDIGYPLVSAGPKVPPPKRGHRKDAA